MASASKSQRPKVSLLITIFVIILMIFAVGVFYFSYQQPSEILNNSDEEQVDIVDTQLIAGDIGEVVGEDGMPIVKPTMPASIFSTVGKISKINGDKLIVFGVGTNFVDGKSRDLTVTFLETTITLVQTPVAYYKGKDGMDKLYIGANILLMSRENIRGKTEFSLTAVKVLE